MSEITAKPISQLNYIAVNVCNSNHEDFLKTLADAWLRADPDNKQILRSAWTEIIKIYHLDEEAEGGEK